MEHILDCSTLIIEMEKRPSLYNTKLKEYHDKSLREKLWTEVYKAVISDWNYLSATEKRQKGHQVQRRWKSLRDCYRRELHVSSRGNVNKKKYIYFDQMSFLGSAIKDRAAAGNNSSLKCSKDEEESDVDASNVETSNISQKRKKQRELQADAKRTHKEKCKEQASSENYSSVAAIEYEDMSEDSTADSAMTPSTRFPKLRKLRAKAKKTYREKPKEHVISDYNLLPVSVELEEGCDVAIEDGPCNLEPPTWLLKQRKMPQERRKTYGDMLLDVLRDRAMEDIDEDKAFLMSLFPGFKRLNEDKKFTAKMEILQVMRRVQLMSAQGPSKSAAMPEYKLIYFNGKGRAELIRWIFAYGKIPYTDERIEFSDWPARKPSVYTNKVPVLMVDGIPLPESLAIARYLAKQAGLVPEDIFLAAKVDAGIDQFADIHLETRKILHSPISNEEKAKQMREELFPNVLKPFLTKLNQDLEGRDWYVGDKVSWLDLNSACTFDNHLIKIPNLLDDFPNVERNMKRVMALPGIKEWIAKRPETFM